jgi:isoleucyl-tRNA synthetase
VQIERKVKEGLVAANSGELTVVLDTALDEELLEEGMAREIINKINTMRREQGLAVTDRIRVRMEAGPQARRAFEAHRSLICHEVLATEVAFGPCAGVGWELNGEEAKIEIALS